MSDNATEKMFEEWYCDKYWNFKSVHSPSVCFKDGKYNHFDVDLAYNAFLAGLAAGAPKWQPIETAPKNGTLVLLGWFERWRGEPPKFVTQVAVAGNLLPGRAGFLHGQATYWMPLSPAPQQ